MEEGLGEEGGGETAGGHGDLVEGDGEVESELAGEKELGHELGEVLFVGGRRRAAVAGRVGGGEGVAADARAGVESHLELDEVDVAEVADLEPGHAEHTEEASEPVQGEAAGREGAEDDGLGVESQGGAQGDDGRATDFRGVGDRHVWTVGVVCLG